MNLTCSKYFKWTISPLIVLCIIITRVPWRVTYKWWLCWRFYFKVPMLWADIWMYYKLLLYLLFYPKKMFTWNSLICYLSYACLFLQQFVRCLYIYLELEETSDSSEIISLPPGLEKGASCIKGLSFSLKSSRECSALCGFTVCVCARMHAQVLSRTIPWIPTMCQTLCNGSGIHSKQGAYGPVPL